MEYRILPKRGIKLSTIGIGSGSVHASDEKQTIELIDYAEEQGINLIDMALSYPQPLDHYGVALRGRREKFHLQLHLGINFEAGEYARDYTREAVERTFEDQLKRLGSDYADIALFHCIDTAEGFEQIMEGGVFDYAVELKKAGIIRNLGFATHTVDIAHRFIATGEIEVFMFSVNAAYDVDPLAHDPHGKDSKRDNTVVVSQDRQRLYQECVRLGIGIHVMKAYAGGRLLKDQTSPFGRAMTIPQCIKYALDRPAVLSCILGVRNTKDLQEAAAFYSATAEELDYSFIAEIQPKELRGACVYCNHCMPCPAGIDIGMTHKFLDLYLAGDEMAKEHYQAMPNNAHDCMQCGICEERCPFGVDVRSKMASVREVMVK